MLKSSNDSEINIFTARVLNFINPKFEDELTELPLAEAELYSFARHCELTADEFLIALRMAADSQLTSVPDDTGKTQHIKLYREIDSLKLGEVKAAYINHKRFNDKKYEAGRKLLSEYLNPEQIELTPEQKKESRLNFLKEQYSRLQDGKEILGYNLFYPMVKKTTNGYIKIGFVERVLNSFIPEKKSSHLDASGKLEIPKLISNNITSYWEENLVKTYIQFNKLNELSENDWIDHWEKLFESK